MTTRDCESFKMSPNSADFATYGRFVTTQNLTVYSSGAPFGDPYATFASFAYLQRRTIPGGPFTTLFFSGRMIISNATSGNYAQISAYDQVNAANQVSVLFYAASGVIQIVCGTTVLLTTGPGQFPLNAWFWFSIKFVIGTGTAGAVGVQIACVQKVNLSGVNTQFTARGYCDTTNWYSPAYSAGFSLTHLIWNDAAGTYNNSYMSDQRVVGELPTLAGDTTQLTPVGNSQNYLNAAECPPTGDTDYNYSGTVGNLDLYKLGAPSGVTGVSAVMVSAIGRKDDSGSRNLATQIKSGGTIGSGVSTPLASSYTTQSDVWETDPSTGVPFTAAALGTLQVGGKVSA